MLYHLYANISFRRGDIATEVYELIYQFLKFAIFNIIVEKKACDWLQGWLVGWI